MGRPPSSNDGDRFPCTWPKCHRTFSRNYSVKLHMDVHKDIRKYPCTLCDRSFSQRSLLGDHMNTHTGDKPYPCKPEIGGCGMSFRDYATLRVHQIRGCNGRYRCPVSGCDESFKKRYVALNHQKQCHPESQDRILFSLRDSPSGDTTIPSTSSQIPPLTESSIPPPGGVSSGRRQGRKGRKKKVDKVLTDDLPSYPDSPPLSSQPHSTPSPSPTTPPLSQLVYPTSPAPTFAGLRCPDSVSDDVATIETEVTEPSESIPPQSRSRGASGGYIVDDGYPKYPSILWWR